jgi:hypothetical protein
MPNYALNEKSTQKNTTQFRKEMNMNNMHEIFGKVIHRYTREEAISDGVLVGLTALFPDECRLYRYPVACTAAVWSLIDMAATNPTQCNSHSGVVWDILYMSQHAIISRPDEQTVIFSVIITGAGRKRVHRLKALCGPGDLMEPVVTIMLPEED